MAAFRFPATCTLAYIPRQHSITPARFLIALHLGPHHSTTRVSLHRKGHCKISTGNHRLHIFRPVAHSGNLYALSPHPPSRAPPHTAKYFQPFWTMTFHLLTFASTNSVITIQSFLTVSPLSFPSCRGASGEACGVSSTTMTKPRMGPPSRGTGTSE